MKTMKICFGCQKPIEANAPDGLCPECLLKAGLGTAVGLGPDSQAEVGQVPFVAPTPEELVKPFPQLEILGFIGQGGMGAVYKARQKALDRIVALKILPPGIGKDPAFAQRFTREAKALAKLNHPGIVTLYEFGQADGLFFFLMEFVDGVNLRHLLEAGRVSPREALAIVPQICDALQYAHDQGIVHRDIKPENILLDRQGRVKVADFGLAKLVEMDAGGIPLTPSLSPSGGEGAPALTEAGKVMGTPQYMAPEQREHPTEVDHRADIYSLGVVFYQMLTGELPGKPIEPPSHTVRVDVRLDEVVLRALEKAPERRYQQVSQMKSAVETISQSGPPVDANVQPADWRTWSPFQSQQVREICAHMTEAERRECTLRGAFFGIWNAATCFVPCGLAFLAPQPLNWILAPIVLLVGLAFYPLWRRITREFLASTRWARQQGIAPESLEQAVLHWSGLLRFAVIFVVAAGLFSLIFYWLAPPPRGLVVGLLVFFFLMALKLQQVWTAPAERLPRLDAPARSHAVRPWIVGAVGMALLVPVVVFTGFVLRRLTAKVETVRQESPNRVLEVRCEGRKADIQAELDDRHDLHLSIGNDALGWSSQHTGSTSVTATVEASSQIKMADGSIGRGLVFQAWGSRHYIPITPEGPVPYGEVVFRPNSRANESGSFTFADIRQANGTLIPVAIGVRPVSDRFPGSQSFGMVAETAAQPGGPWTARLPSGVTVELLGVAEDPSLNRPWWRPDGTPLVAFAGPRAEPRRPWRRPDGAPLESAPYDFLGASVAAEPGKVTRQIAVRLRNLAGHPVDVQWRFDPPCDSSGGGMPTQIGIPVADLRALVVRVPAAAPTLTVRVGVAAGRRRAGSESRATWWWVEFRDVALHPKQPPAGTNAMVFGPVIERTVTSVFKDAPTCFLDLDSGEFRAPLTNLLAELRGMADRGAVPIGVLDAPGGELYGWLKQSGADMLGCDLEHGASLLFFGTTPVAVPNPALAFDTTTPEQVANFCRDIKNSWDETKLFQPIPVHRVRLNEEPWNANLLPFRTREGGMGVMQVVGFTDNPRGMKIRYKLGYSASKAARLKLQQAQADLVEAKARHDAGLASLSEFQTVQLARDVAEGELNGDTAAILRAKRRFAQEQLLLAEARFNGGLASLSELRTAQLARDVAEAELSGDTAAILRVKRWLAQEQLLLAEARFKRGLATQAEVERAKLAKDLSEAQAQR